MAVSGSERARIEAVVRQHEWLIGLLAKRHGRYRRGIPRPDLLHAGRIGLWNAARGFDEARGVKFASYAGVFVLAEFRREFRVVKGEGHAALDDAPAASDGRAWEHDAIRRIDGTSRLRVLTATMRGRDAAIVRAVLEKGLTPADIARRLRISRARVGQILCRATAAARAVAAA